MRVAPEDGRMLATSARKADACAALLVGDTGFHTKGTGTATAVCSFMTSAHKWPSLESSLSRPVLPLLGCRPPMLVAPERVGVCCGLLVLAGPVPKPHCWCLGLGGGTLEDCWKLDCGLNTRYIACTSNFMYFTLNVSQIECTSN